MESHKRTIVIVLLAWLAGACGGKESRWAGTITDSAGVTIVSNTELGIWSPGDEWTLEEELRIGVQEGDPQYQFGEVASIAVDSRDRIFVLDRMADQIRVYSADGAYQQTVGGRGGGPGELNSPWLLLMAAGDTLLVPDSGNMRVNRYAPDGSSVGSFRLVPERGRALKAVATTSGMVAEQFRSAEFFGSPARGNPTDLILLLAPDGTVTDTLMTFPSGEMFTGFGVKVYAPEPIWALTDDLQLLFGVNDQYRIGFYSDGQLRRVIAKSFEPRRVDDREIEAIMGPRERMWTEAGLSAEQRRQARSRWQFAEFFPALRSLAVGPMGTTWVQHVQPVSEVSREELGSTRNPAMSYWDIWGHAPTPGWDVFDSEGRFLGVVSMPPRFTLKLLRGDKAYGVWRDEFDVQYVVRLHVVGDLVVGAT